MADDVPPRASSDPWDPPPTAAPYAPAPPPPPSGGDPTSPEAPTPPQSPTGSEPPTVSESPTASEPSPARTVSEPAERPTEVVPAADAHAGPELDPEVAPEPPTGPPPPADADLGSASVPAGDPGASAVAPPPATRKRSKIIGIVIGAVVILLAICGVGAALLLRSANHTTNAKVGTCLTGDSINQKGDKSQQVNLKDVSCSNKDAKYKVVGRVEKKKETEATDEVCNPYPDADFIYWEGPKGKTGVVLCLATNG